MSKPDGAVRLDVVPLTLPVANEHLAMPKARWGLTFRDAIPLDGHGETAPETHQVGLFGGHRS
ncbi:MAG: hypothetical protein FJ090_14795 [Deltaproteobacteria bacterium]|nr:hypothetical protein [Deltaproteobacteria bacterium]